MSSNISRTVIFDGIKGNCTEGLDSYDADLSTVPLFRDYPELLLQLTFASYILFMVIGIIGNLITICALARYKQIRNATAIFIINLSIADLAVCCAVSPVIASVLINKSWILGKTLCRIHPLLWYSLSGVSFFTVVAITINRYVLIVYPHMYHRCYNKQKMIIMIMAIWTLSFAMLIPTLFEVWGRFSLDPCIGFCALVPDINKRSPKKLIIYTFFFLPCTIMFLCYIHIYMVVKKVVKKSTPKTENGIDIVNRDESSTGSSNFKTKTRTTEIIEELSNGEPNSVENGNEMETNQVRFTRYNMSKKVRKHLRSKLKEINMKQWLPTRKDKRLRTMTIAIMICFCVNHLPMMLIKTLISERSAPPTLVFLSYILMSSATCLNPIIYVVMSREYREAYKSFIISLFA